MASALDYHERTKHYFHRFARSLGVLDWASQPNPFRRHEGARIVILPRLPLALDIPYSQIYQASLPDRSPDPLTPGTIAEFLRCSLGLSAWKQYGSSRWALRVNPSSGNLHPTESYIVTGLPALTSAPGRSDGQPPSTFSVFHYAPREHLLEERGVMEAADGDLPCAGWSDAFLVGLTSIHWREAWKYGERAFRYCQHDAGHAIAGLRLAASLFGWRMALLPRWSDTDVSTLLGLEPRVGHRDAPEIRRPGSPDPEESEQESPEREWPEREWPDCLAVVSRGDARALVEAAPEALVAAVRRASWRGTPNRLSPHREEWPLIEDVARATGFPGVKTFSPGFHNPRGQRSTAVQRPDDEPAPSLSVPGPGTSTLAPGTDPVMARSVILQRRSALGFDGRSSLPKATLVSMLQRLRPGAPPWDAIWWETHVHLVLFVHRVDGLPGGMYAFVRAPGGADALRAACRDDLLWEAVPEAEGLFLLAPLDCRAIAKRLSCDQEIAADGFFALAMIARFEEPLRSRGDWFYRNLFWECGMVGQVLYLEAEAAGARATGIGCYYDDPVHDLLGLSGHAWQSLYHFSMGVPVEDARLTTEPGYEWEG